VEKNKINSLWRIFALISFLAIAATAIWTTRKFLSDVWSVAVDKGLGIWRERIYDSREKWITVFVHGTFGSTASLLDPNAVRRDEVEGSTYKKVVREMRKNPFFLNEQSIMEKKGLIQVRPSFDVSATREQCIAAPPIAKAYDLITNSVFEGSRNNKYYVFGWSGLLSQKRRRKEAVRLYNSLIEERDKLIDLGFEPKIRIISHSHGGNLVLNLGGLRDAMDGEWNTLPEENNEEFLPIKNDFKALLNSLPKKEIAMVRGEQKRFDYFPDKPLLIDEFIMLGAPIQPETAYFARSNTFGLVCNIYSDEDRVQELDFISTSGSSEKRLDFLNLKESKNNNRIVQARVTVSRQVDLDEKGDDEKRMTWWKVLLGLHDITRKRHDPTHREMWFIVAPKDDDECSFKPLPTVTFVPAVIKLLHDIPDAKDVDIDFSLQEHLFLARLFYHNEKTVKGTISLQKSLISTMQNKLKAWEPCADDKKKSRKILEDCISLCKNSQPLM
jgi:hypothetical protein